MSLAVAFLLAASTAQAAPGDRLQPPDRGAQVDTARVSVTIVSPAVIQGGVLLSSAQADAPHSQRQSAAGSVTYIFE